MHRDDSPAAALAPARARSLEDEGVRMTMPARTSAPTAHGASRREQEALLVEGLKRGDLAAYEQLYREHGARMLGTARRYLPVLQDAEDAVQDAMVSLVRSIERFEGTALFTTWLHRVVVNASLMRIRTRTRRPETSLDGLPEAGEHEGLRGAPRWAATADQLIEREDMRHWITAGINSLPETYRLPLVLREVEGWDMATICAGLGVGLSTLKARLSRARTLLREKLDPRFGAGSS